MALESADLSVGERRTAASDDVPNASGVDAEHVHVTFHQDGVIGFANGILRSMQVVKDVTFPIERCLGRVEVLRLITGAKGTSAEADHFAGFVVNREHQPSAKPVEESAAILTFHHQA